MYGYSMENAPKNLLPQGIVLPEPNSNLSEIKVAHCSPVSLLELDGNKNEFISPRLTNGETKGKGSSGCTDMDTLEIDRKRLKKIGKFHHSRNRRKDASVDGGADADADQPCQCPGSTCEEKVSNLKIGLVHVARKMPKNAHVHFILGLMYQRLGQPQKAVLAYEKAEEILLHCEVEVPRPKLLSLVQIHHAQCILLENSSEEKLDEELGTEELEEILCRSRESMQLDIRRAAVWNTLGLLLLKSGRLQSAISIMTFLLTADPNNYDCIANLGIAHLQSGSVELSARCFQDLVIRDQHHPAALINYSAILLCKCGSVVAGAGASVSLPEVEDVQAAEKCLLAALQADPKPAHIWANLANAYYLVGDHRRSRECLEKAARLEPKCMSTRYSVAVQRIKDAELYQDGSEQLSWAGNEMASISREGDSVPVEFPIARTGLAMVHEAQHGIAAAFETEHSGTVDAEERALCSLKQAVEEDPEDAVRWHQLGLHFLCSRQFEAAQKYLKVAVARSVNRSCAWSNLGIALQLSGDLLQAEELHKKASACAAESQLLHAMCSNLGNVYRQQKQYERAKAMFSKALELRPGYAPAFNNLGLVFAAEAQWEAAKFCFDKSLMADPLLDAAKSNKIKASAAQLPRIIIL